VETPVFEPSGPIFVWHAACITPQGRRGTANEKGKQGTPKGDRRKRKEIVMDVLVNAVVETLIRILSDITLQGFLTNGFYQ
jgi:hypothetical protein